MFLLKVGASIRYRAEYYGLEAHRVSINTLDAEMVRQVGIEPTASRFQGGVSTTDLLPENTVSN